MRHLDSQIIESVNNREFIGWEILFDCYYAPLCAFVNKILNSKSTAEDIVQETFINLWQLGRTFDSQEYISRYLYRAVYNNTMMYIRNYKSGKTTLDTVENCVCERCDDIESEREELLREVYLILEDLTDHQREIVLLGLDGLSGKEIAARLNITIHTVKSLKNRVLKKIRQKLQG